MSVLDNVLRRLPQHQLELTANDRLQLERSARSAVRTLLQWIEATSRFVLRKQAKTRVVRDSRHLVHRNASPSETIALQLLAARMQLLWKSYHTDGLLDAVQMLTLLFLLVVRGSIFRDVPVEPWDSVDLVCSSVSNTYTQQCLVVHTTTCTTTGWLPVGHAVYCVAARHLAAPPHTPLLVRAPTRAHAVPSHAGALPKPHSGPMPLQ